MLWFSAYSAPVQSRITKDLAASALVGELVGLGESVEARRRLRCTETLLGITQSVRV